MLISYNVLPRGCLCPQPGEEPPRWMVSIPGGLIHPSMPGRPRVAARSAVDCEVNLAQQDGLIYYPSPYNPPLGHAGFEVRLSDTPGDRYFDAHRALFPVEHGGALRRLAVEHPYRLGEELRFTSGRIRLEAHRGDVEEIVTFGGHAVVNVEGGETVCRVTSSAPFLPLAEGRETPFVLLAGELEVIMAESRAGWGRDESSHLDRLGEVEPMTLFVASLMTLEERLGRLAHVERDDETRQALHLVREMRHRLERAGQWPSSAAGLSEIL